MKVIFNNSSLVFRKKDLSVIELSIEGTISSSSSSAAIKTTYFDVEPNAKYKIEFENDEKWTIANYTGTSYILTLGYVNNEGTNVDFNRFTPNKFNNAWNSIVNELRAGYEMLTGKAYIAIRADSGQTINVRLTKL